MKKYLYLTVFASLFCGLLPGAEATAQTVKERLTAHTSYLSSDKLFGRGAGYKETAGAAQYVSDEYRKLGLMPFYPSGFYKIFEGSGKYGAPGVVYRNVVGMLEGYDPDLRNEYVLVCANYDGYGSVTVSKTSQEYITKPSANDNASGVAALIETARALKAESGNLKRSVLFCALDGDILANLGTADLFGSLDKSKVAVVIILDKLGAMDAYGKLSVSGAGSIADGVRIAEECARREDVTAAVKAFDNNLFREGKDELFAVNGVPAITVTTGRTGNEKDADDTADKLDYEGMAKATGFTAALAAAAASDPSFRKSGVSARKYNFCNRSFKWGVTAGIGYNYQRYYREGTYLMSKMNWGLVMKYKQNITYNVGLTAQYDFGIFGVQAQALFQQARTDLPVNFNIRTSRCMVDIPVTLLVQTPGRFSHGIFGGAGGTFNYVFSKKFSSGPAAPVANAEAGFHYLIGLRQYNLTLTFRHSFMLTNFYTGITDGSQVLKLDYKTLSLAYYF